MNPRTSAAPAARLTFSSLAAPLSLGLAPGCKRLVLAMKMGACMDVFQSKWNVYGMSRDYTGFICKIIEYHRIYLE